MTIIVALLLAGAQTVPTPAWLTGTWVADSDSSRQDEGACDGDGARRWSRGGYFGHGAADGPGIDGRWRLDAGGRLTETDASGIAQQGRIERLGPNRLRLTDQDGERLLLVRCRAR